ncbi:trafficking protein particle complex subunit 14 isoform X1 [Boleophthalmus pectinirostris]|uniref:trafficking protein particle complex subunit 14 isoform X1 n=2 Tax=Boleophthalmus pectinirostris TaxID=150288 RepID=UPI002431877F|nr:trafficking protein particle complex subunit 14 isoform X1 [Boleophthalmus pectinirostris]
MVQEMESQCEYLMYFPAVPLSELSDPARYRSLPRRSHLYLGETVRFLLVLRCRDSRLSESTESGSWRDLASSLCAVASVSPGDSSRHRGNHHHHGDEQDDYMAAAEAAIAALGSRVDSRCRSFRDCKPLIIHTSRGHRRANIQSPLDEPVVLSDEVIFPLTVSLDKLPVSTLKVKVMVTVWKREQDKAEVQELGYLSVLQQRAPVHTFRHDLNTFKAQVSTTLSVLPPPTVRCKQMTVSGRHLAVLKVLNECSQEELSIRDVRILPNLNASYLPVMPDGSVLLVDNVCHQSGEVGMGSFSRVDTPSGRLPSMLSALEEHDFLFQLHLNDTNQEESTEGLEVPLVAVVQWSTPKMPFTNCIYTHYRLPSIRLDQPRFVMTASCPRTVRVKEHFRVRYVLLNNLQDFLAVRLVWTPEARGSDDPSLSSVVCLSPLSNLGHCRKGSTLSFSVGFQILRPGLYELSQHMKLKLQFTASVSNPPPDARPLSRKNSPSSPAVRDLLDRHQASLGRSQSFSHQQPSRSHIMRTGSAMERRAITPPVGSPVGRSLYLPPPERTVLSLDKIAKRECKVLVLDAAA